MTTRRRVTSLVALAIVLQSSYAAAVLAQAAPVNQADAVIAQADKEGKNKYSDYGTGVPQPLALKEFKLDADPNGMHCTGFTFTVVFKLLEARDDFKNMTKAALEKLHKDWYGLNDGESKEKGLQHALTQAKLGVPVDKKDLAEGDLVFFWRAADPATRQGMGPAHAAIITEVKHSSTKNRILGIKYVSVQRFTPTPGSRIGDFEWLDDTDDDAAKTKQKKADGTPAVVTINGDRFYAARLNPPP